MRKFFNEFFIFLTIFVSCSKDKDSMNIPQLTIESDSFGEEFSLIGETVEFDNILNPFRINIIRDSLALIENKSPNPFYFQIVNLKTMKIITEFAERGKGPNEFLGAKFISNIYNETNSDEVIIFDLIKRRVTEYHLDSLLNSTKNYFSEKKYDFISYVEYFSRLGEKNYICYNPFYLDNDNYSNNTEPLFIANEDQKTSNEENIKYFTPNVTGGVVLVSPDKSKIIIAERFIDKISFYDKNLNLFKTILGPNINLPTYKIKPEGNTVVFDQGQRKDSYIQGVGFENHIYLIYGKSQNPDFSAPELFEPVEVFKLTWEGELLKKYILDTYIFTISISQDEKTIYGTTINSEGIVVLKRYKLI